MNTVKETLLVRQRVLMKVLLVFGVVAALALGATALELLDGGVAGLFDSSPAAAEYECPYLHKDCNYE